MLDSVEEKACMLVNDVERFVGVSSPLYVHMYDLYVDIVQLNDATKKVQNEKANSSQGANK